DSVTGEAEPPSVAERPPSTGDPTDIPLDERPVLGKGDVGDDVEDLQEMLNGTELRPDLEEDGDFGPATENAVITYQATRGLAADGLGGPITWDGLYENKQPLPPPPHALKEHEIATICAIALESEIARYPWEDRGIAPVGYMQGMALAF